MVLGKLDIHMEKMKLDHYFILLTKINWKWIEALNILPRNNKTHGKSSFDIDLDKNFVWLWHNKPRQQKQKQVWLYETEKLLHHKRNSQQNEKVTNGVGENICKPSIWEGDNPKYIRNTTQ